DVVANAARPHAPHLPEVVVDPDRTDVTALLETYEYLEQGVVTPAARPKRGDHQRDPEAPPRRDPRRGLRKRCRPLRPNAHRSLVVLVFKPRRDGLPGRDHAGGRCRRRDRNGW